MNLSNKFSDPLEQMFQEKFGINTFQYVQQLIHNGSPACKAYENLNFQMDNILNDFRFCNNQWVTIQDGENSPFFDSVAAVPSGFCSQSGRTAAGCL